MFFILKKMRKLKAEFEDLFQYTSFILLKEKLGKNNHTTIFLLFCKI